jgi:hypothetical protein
LGAYGDHLHGWCKKCAFSELAPIGVGMRKQKKASGSANPPKRPSVSNKDQQSRPRGAHKLNSNSGDAPPIAAPEESARSFVAAAAAALVDIQARFPTGVGAVEVAHAERIRAAGARLLECAHRLTTDGPMIIGSTGQPRPHQLLRTEQELRHEIAEALRKLAVSAEQGAMFARVQALTRKGGERR